MARAPILLAAALVATMWSGDAFAQRRSCTQAYQECRVQSNNALACSSGLDRCLQTGIWIGPISGRNAGPHIKK